MDASVFGAVTEAWGKSKERQLHDDVATMLDMIFPTGVFEGIRIRPIWGIL